MTKKIIKDNDNSKAVKQEKTEIHKGQVESSISKAVKKKDDIFKAAEDKATFRDYSGKIRYGDAGKKPDEVKPEKSGKGFEKVKKAKQSEKRCKSIVKSNSETEIVKNDSSTDIVKPQNTADIVRADGQTDISKNIPAVPVQNGGSKNVYSKVIRENRQKSIVKPKNAVGIVKSDSRTDIVKSASKTEIVKPQYSGKSSAPQDKITDIDSPAYKKAIKNQLKQYAKTKAADGKKQNIAPKSHLDVSDVPNGIVKPRTEISVLEHRSGKEDIISHDQTYAFSTAPKDLVDGTVTYTDGSQRSRLSQMAHERQIQAIKSRYVDDNAETTAFEYKDDTEQAKEQANREMVKEHSLPIREHKETPIKHTEKAVRKQAGGKGKNKNKRTTYATLAAGAVKSGAHLALKNSEDKTLEIAEGTISAVETAKDILKPETVSPKKRLQKLNRQKAAQAASAYGVKAELKQNIKNIVLDKNDQAGELLKTGGKSVLKAIRQDISEKADNDLAFKAVDDVIKTSETAAAAKDIYCATSNGVKDIYHAGKSTVKAIKNAPQNAAAMVSKTKAAVKKAQYTKKRFDSFRRLKNKHKTAIIKSNTKKAVKQTAETALKSVKSAAIKVLALLLVNVIVVVAICGLVVGAIGSFIWQTPSALDTTEVIKYISDLDYKRQNAWFSKGASAVVIDGMNDNNSDNSYSYTYAIAYDVPPEVANSDDITPDNINCKVRIGQDSHGETLLPSYSGFNKIFSSSDEVVECMRWTTDDYRAALAFIQTKKENLGWFSNLFGFVGKEQLKSAAEELHNATYKQNIVIENVDQQDGTVDYSLTQPIYTKTYHKHGNHSNFYFGRKYSVKYLIDNDMIRFNSDDAKNASMKERFYYTYKYGNFAVANLDFPLELEDGEKISDRITKHFGTQLILYYEPPEHDPDKTMYGKVKGKKGYHYATDLSANSGDIIYAPLGGLCKATQREGRGFEYVISTAYNGNNFDFTKDGYLVKISCSSASFIAVNTPQVITKGTALGKVANDIGVNDTQPDSDNDSADNEDIIADLLFPCNTSTDFRNIGGNNFNTHIAPEENHIHIEMYKLPCDFSDAADVKKNILAPELFFDYSQEDEE